MAAVSDSIKEELSNTTPAELLDTASGGPDPLSYYFNRNRPEFVKDVIDFSSLDYVRTENVTEDGGIIKHVLREGEGEVTPMLSKVSVHYEARYDNGELFDSSVFRKIPVHFKVGTVGVLKGWHLAVATMRVGELSMFRFSAEYAYGKLGAPPRVPPNAVLYFQIELLRSTPPKQFESPVLFADRLRCALAEKDEGNTLLQTGAHAKAFTCYNRAVDHFAGYDFKTEPVDEPSMNRYNDLMMSLQLNRALCCMKSQKWENAKKCCNEVLRRNPNQVKALFRRGVAHFETKHFQDSVNDLTKASTLDPNDSGISNFLRKAQKSLKDIQTKNAFNFGNFFERLQHEEVKDSQKQQLTKKILRKKERLEQEQALRLKLAELNAQKASIDGGQQDVEDEEDMKLRLEQTQQELQTRLAELLADASLADIEDPGFKDIIAHQVL
eukprot:GILK01011830.1.p1 GENE.GILK01011830.1~~GILK01011830.1.p1  ORF type:complete len:456 (+),score=91.03 GILK01011830.1:52-1368(+)